MQYAQRMQGVFHGRPNRFIAYVEIAGREEIVHVKNTGRCKELLLPGATVYVQHFPEGKRKTKYDLIAVEKQNLLINMDSQAPNKVVQEWLMEQEPFGKITYLKPECKHGDSRFDFYLETEAKKMFIEVKGVTLEEKGVVMFPDAPTERGVKHVQELCHCLEQGYEAAIVFVVQMSGMRYFTPNRRTHAAFAEALERAEACGVRMLALSCEVTPESLAINGEIPIHLAG